MADANTTTQSTVDSSVATQDSGKVNTNPDTQNAATSQQSASQTDNKASELESIIQRAVDRATNKLGNENKKLRGEIEELRKSKLSDEELKQLEMQEKEKEIAERERQLLDKENRLLAIKAIKEIGLDDGSDASLALVDFVMGEDEAAIKERVKVFDALVKRIVKAQVDNVFKTNGRTPGTGSTTTETNTKKDSVAVRIGQNAAKANKHAQSTLDYYIGGKKK